MSNALRQQNRGIAKQGTHFYDPFTTFFVSRITYPIISEIYPPFPSRRLIFVENVLTIGKSTTSSSGDALSFLTGDGPETDMDKLIRTGKLTPFDRLEADVTSSSQPEAEGDGDDSDGAANLAIRYARGVYVCTL